MQENAFENVVWEMTAILSWPQCVNQDDATFSRLLAHGKHDDIMTWKPFFALLVTIRFWRCELLMFIWYKPEQAVEQTVKLVVIESH